MTVVCNDPESVESLRASQSHHTPQLQTRNEAIFNVALCYIATPCFIFLLSFVRPILGWPLAALLGWTLFKSITGERWNWSPNLYIPAGLLALSLVFVVGIPTGHSAWDWIKHWALINELAGSPWPVSVDLRGDHLYLRYYLAAYLVPAFVHKAFPAIPVPAAVTAWFFLGYLLVFCLIGVAFRKRSLAIATAGMILVITLTGADGIMRHIIGVLWGKPLLSWIGFHYYAWPGIVGRPLGFDSGLANLAWVPNQSIAVFIVSALILMDYRETGLTKVLVGYGLLALWSPYGMIGLLPLVLLRVAQCRKWLTRGYGLQAAIVGTIFALLAASYLSTDLPPGGICVSCTIRRPEEIVFVILFLVVELITFLLLLRKRSIKDPYCAVALATLILIPFFHGKTIDFVARSSMGPLFILATRSAERVLELRFSWAETMPVMVSLALCLPTSLSEVAFHAEKGAAYRTPYGRTMPEASWTGAFSTNSIVSVPEFLDSCGWKFAPQYFSHTRPKVLKPD